MQLVSDASWLIDTLGKSNVDRRAVAIIEDMHEQLEASRNVVRVGITNIACQHVIPRVEEMVAAPIVARLNAFSAGVALYVSQFEAWHRFVDNAADHDARPSDARRAHAVGRQLVIELKAAPLLLTLKYRVHLNYCLKL